MPGSFPPPLGALTTSLPPDRGETLALQQFPSFPSLSFFLFPFFLFPLPFLRAVLRPGSSCPRRAAKQPPTPTRDSPAVRRRGVLEGRAGGGPGEPRPCRAGGSHSVNPPSPPGQWAPRQLALSRPHSTAESRRPALRAGRDGVLLTRAFDLKTSPEKRK